VRDEVGVSTEPTSELLDLPKGYGTPKTPMEWAAVRDRLEATDRFWLATTRPDGRPHVIPIDGIWLDGRWYFGGAPQTVSMRNLKANPEVVVHLDDPMRAVMVEGVAEWVTPSPQDAARLADASNAKYGYGMKPEQFAGTWALRPRRVLAWENFPTDCTRFVFA
jgi:nitroimidazol reductase NimA-like FMN-containing flavoprotein (pyridoxamine 5'-phosphate oxidase superfamily)